MKIYQKFLAQLYLKNFVILFLSLELFFTGIDLLQNFKHLPHSANLQILYTSNMFMSFVNYTLPLSLLFAMLTTIFQLIRSNELVSIYSLGASKTQVITPIFLLASLITLLYIALNASSFVQANEHAYNIKSEGKVTDTTQGVFLKSKDDYVYFASLDPLKKEAVDIRIFHTKGADVTQITRAKSAHFLKDHWELHDVTQITKPPIQNKEAKLHYQSLETLSTLKGFKPQIIDNLFKGTSRLNIQDSLGAIKLLKQQNLSSDKIRANLYLLIAFPLFVPLALLVLFYPLPAQRRSANIALLSTMTIFGVLVLWGILFTLSKIAFNGALSPEVGILLPLFLLLLLAFFIITKYR